MVFLMRIMADKKLKAPKPEAPPQHRESRTSFVFVPDNKRIDDPVKIVRRLRDVNAPYTFVVGADTQFGLMAKTQKKNSVDWEAEQTLFNKCIERINNLNPKPKFFALVGDMCDSPPTGTNEYALRRQQERDFFLSLENLDDEIYFVPVSGEHDVGDEPIHLTLNRYRLSFGQEFYDFHIGGVQFIVISSQYYVNNSHVPSLAEDQEKWLDSKLGRDDSPIGPIIFMHVPPFVNDINEPDSKDAIVKSKREKLLKKFVDAGVKYVFCGHLHKNATVKYSTLNIITTSAIGEQRGADKSGFRVVTIHADQQLDHTYIPIETTTEPNS